MKTNQLINRLNEEKNKNKQKLSNKKLIKIISNNLWIDG